jgi:hypothetical protein
MGIDFYTCENCNAIFDDCGNTGGMCKCEQNFCGGCYNEFAKKYGVDDNGYLNNCWFCDKSIKKSKKIKDFIKSLTKKEFRELRGIIYGNIYKWKSKNISIKIFNQ